MKGRQCRDNVEYHMRLKATYQLESLRVRDGGHAIPQHLS